MKVKDLTGQKFGKLTVIKRGPRRAKHLTWVCICECEKETAVRADHLKTGNTVTCGGRIHRRERAKIKDLTGQKIGRLTVIEREILPSRHAYWLCDCSCGNITVVRGSHLRSRAVLSCGCILKETARKLINAINEHFGMQRTLTLNGITKNAGAWAKDVGLKSGTAITRRLKRGWSIERALTTAPLPRRRAS